MTDNTTPAAPEGNFDVREALAAAIDPMAHAVNWYADAQDPRDRFDGLRIKRAAYSTAARILAEFDVRPRGTVTDADGYLPGETYSQRLAWDARS